MGNKRTHMLHCIVRLLLTEDDLGFYSYMNRFHLKANIQSGCTHCLWTPTSALSCSLSTMTNVWKTNDWFTCSLQGNPRMTICCSQKLNHLQTNWHWVSWLIHTHIISQHQVLSFTFVISCCKISKMQL